MPRRGNVPKREVLPDPLYNSILVTKLTNSIMLDGKKGVAQKVVYGAFDIIKEKTDKDPMEVYTQALENIMPSLEVKARRVGGAIPKEYIPAVDAGIQGAMQAGVLAGYPVVDVKVTLYDGSFHEVDSSEMAFKIAGSMAFKEACRKANAVLLEPIMKVSVIVPEEYMGDVMGDLNSRRGQILGMEARPGAQQIDALVPLANMFGYATDLRSSTQGRGQYSMEPHSYVEIPKSIADKIIAERGRSEG